MSALPALDLADDPVGLTEALVAIPSESGCEAALADAVEAALRRYGPRLDVMRDGDAVVARTHRGHGERVVLAGHLDTVPIAGNVPGRREGDRLSGCGSSDMKGGVAVALHLAATVSAPTRDVSFVFYDNEEVDAARNGLGRLQARHPDWLSGDLAILMEPTGAVVEAGCQGTLRVAVTLRGVRAHTARNWVGSNAIHAAAPVLSTLAQYAARRVVIDGCEYREGLSAVRIAGGVAGNVVPDECVVTVNYRFAPDRSVEQATGHLHELFTGYDLEVVDAAAGALPGLDTAGAGAFLAAVGTPPRAKLGWTDVARFAAMGVPALNYGPGDPLVAHTVGEWVDVREIRSAAAVLRSYLTS